MSIFSDQLGYYSYHIPFFPPIDDLISSLVSSHMFAIKFLNMGNVLYHFIPFLILKLIGQLWWVFLINYPFCLILLFFLFSFVLLSRNYSLQFDSMGIFYLNWLIAGIFHYKYGANQVLGVYVTHSWRSRLFKVSHLFHLFSISHLKNR